MNLTLTLTLILTLTLTGAAPPETAYPAWMQGEWKARLSFAGYELPAKDKIPRDQLFAEADVPGFKKCSIALLPDVESQTRTRSQPEPTNRDKPQP